MSYAIHYDCKGHMGALMTMGRGEVISYSRKHKINANSLKEAELICMDEALPQVLWT